MLGYFIRNKIQGPTLFLLFINDLTFSMKHCSADFFADDSTFHVSGKAKQEIESKLQAVSNDANNWSIRNKMPINYDKTISMLIGTRQKYVILTN